MTDKFSKENVTDLWDFSHAGGGSGSGAVLNLGADAGTSFGSVSCPSTGAHGPCITGSLGNLNLTAFGIIFVAILGPATGVIGPFASDD
jgi:hypothetical protein